ncbi:MAG: hypothetical protein JNL38_13245 [Myxococcales bacterium]|jgi:DNA-binding NtrC family response regulator|nr:hypothetical protein [Myxococcales bacterium]
MTTDSYQDDDEQTQRFARRPAAPSVLVLEPGGLGPIASRLVDDGCIVHVVTSPGDLLWTLDPAPRSEAIRVDLVALHHRAAVDLVRRVRTVDWDVPVVVALDADDVDARWKAQALGAFVLAAPFRPVDVSRVAATARLSAAEAAAPRRPRRAQPRPGATSRYTCS